jgi:hypothetical protein
MRLWAGRLVLFAGRNRYFYLFHSFQTGSGAHTASYPLGNGAFSPGLKLPAREADHSLLSSAEVKNGGAVPPLPDASSSLGTLLVKRRDNFTLILYFSWNETLGIYFEVRLHPIFAHRDGANRIYFTLSAGCPTIIPVSQKNKKFWEEVVAYFTLLRHAPHRKRRHQQFFYFCSCNRFPR